MLAATVEASTVPIGLSPRSDHAGHDHAHSDRSADRGHLQPEHIGQSEHTMLGNRVGAEAVDGLNCGH